MKKRKNILIVIIVAIILVIASILLYRLLDDENKLTVAERNWINDNIGTIQNINVVNNQNVFGKDGEGLFYDFIDDFEKEYKLDLNPITFNYPAGVQGLALTTAQSVSDNDIVIYEDHYVLVSQNEEVISKESDLSGKEINILANDLSYVSKYIKSNNLKFKQFDNIDDLNAALDDKDAYALVPLMSYLDNILENNLNVIYHFCDAKIYYSLTVDDSMLGSVLKKYYSKWQENKKEKYNEELFKVFKKGMGLSDTEVDAMQSVTYNYGFVNASPYEVIIGGKYGGIVSVYLQNFSDFAGVEFNFEKYKNKLKFMKAIQNKDIDLYFNYYNYEDSYNNAGGINIEYVVALPRTNNMVVKSINSLISKEVYVEEGSKIANFIKQIEGINVKTYKNVKELSKLNKKDTIIVLDKNTFDYIKTKNLNSYSERYSDYINEEYTFKVRTKSALYDLLKKYVQVMDENTLVLDGVNNHYETVKSGSIITNIAKYILGVAGLIVIAFMVYFKKSKRISIARKIKKDDKMKFIDQLTSLKNRNFLNENIDTWNNNTIYPQTVLVIDLNNVHEINDTYGYNEGDKQIKAMANILIRTQLDNSEILRTDGNEYMIYLVGYNQKQVTNYIHKLSKEIKKLPYNNGAEFGYSMIVDDIKTIEDALNEAMEDMKKQKDKSDEES